MASPDAIAAMVGGGPGLWLAGGPAPELPDHVGAVVATSGSTGNPRRVVLSRAALLAAGQASRQWAGRDLTWHLALSPSYVAGLMVAVRSAVVDRPVITVATDLRDLRPTGQGDAISLVPTQLHRALADARTVEALAAMDVILVGGAALEAGLRSRVEEAGLHVVETYGMSETCGGVVLDGRALPGVRVSVDADNRIWLDTPTAFDGYWGDPEATAGILHDGRIRTADRGRLDAGVLHVLGRVDDVVISGGINVDLAEVRRAALAVDPASEVIGVPDEEWGSRVVVFSSVGDLVWWREHLQAHLPRTWLPRQHVRVDPMPRTPGGKPDRARLRALVLDWSES